MSKKIYVGNLPFSASDAEVRELFAKYGKVVSVQLEMKPGAPKGFGYVEMETGAEEAIRALDKYNMDGKSLNVNEARPQR